MATAKAQRMVYRDNLESLHEQCKLSDDQRTHRVQLIQAVCLVGLILLNGQEPDAE